MPEFLDRLSNMIRDNRNGLSLSQEKLAEMISVSPSFVGQVERGESLPSVETLYDFVCCLNLDVNALFYGQKEDERDITQINNIVHQMDEKKRMLLLEYARLLAKFDL